MAKFFLLQNKKKNQQPDQHTAHRNFTEPRRLSKAWHGMVEHVAHCNWTWHARSAQSGTWPAWRPGARGAAPDARRPVPAPRRTSSPAQGVTTCSALPCAVCWSGREQKEWVLKRWINGCTSKGATTGKWESLLLQSKLTKWTMVFFFFFFFFFFFRGI